MKKIILPILLMALIACESKQSSSEGNDNSAIVSDFLMDVSALEEIDNKTPITHFEEQASEIADDIMDVSDGNILNVLESAKNYSHCVIVVEDHTIVKIVDLEDCKQSGSWGACMPMAEGYIKKGDLDYQEDYINNIIGRPDSQTRTAFMFK